jgi:hypothetical protein
MVYSVMIVGRMPDVGTRRSVLHRRDLDVALLANGTDGNVPTASTCMPLRTGGWRHFFTPP